jgi:hypothetical protein
MLSVQAFFKAPLCWKRPDMSSVSGHPNNTTHEHLQKYDLGFRRVSFGVQDYSQKVQKPFTASNPFTM